MHSVGVQGSAVRSVTNIDSVWLDYACRVCELRCYINQWEALFRLSDRPIISLLHAGLHFLEPMSSASVRRGCITAHQKIASVLREEAGFDISLECPRFSSCAFSSFLIFLHCFRGQGYFFSPIRCSFQWTESRLDGLAYHVKRWRNDNRLHAKLI